MNKRTETRKIKVGNVEIGGQNKVIIQSMCNTKTKDVENTIKQILVLEKAGCEIKGHILMAKEIILEYQKKNK